MKMTSDQLLQWNQFFPPGSSCTFRKDDGTEIETKTRSEAWLGSSGNAVILVEYPLGCWPLSKLRMHTTIENE